MTKARRSPKGQTPEPAKVVELEIAESEAADESGDRLSALEKALLVLEAIVDRPTPVGLPDLTAELGLPRQTIHRVLQQLSETGLLVRDPSRDRYAVGDRMSRLSLAALLTRNQGAPVRSVLKATVAKVQETCNIGVLDGLDFVYLDRIEAEWSLRVHLTAGSRVPAYCTSGGKVLLAWLDRDLREALIRSAVLQPFTAKTITSPAVLSRELDRIREDGYAVNDEEYTIGIVGAAVPVLDPSGRALAAVASHGPSPRLSPDRARAQVPVLQAAARQLASLWRIEAPSAASQAPAARRRRGDRA